MIKTAELWQKALDTQGYKKAKALKKLQNHLWANQHFVESIAITQEMRDVYKSLDDTYLWIHYSWVAALRYSATDCLDSAIEMIEECQPAALEQADDYYLGLIFKIQGEVCSKQGLFESSEDAYQLAIKHFEQFGEWSLCGDAHQRLGQMNRGRQASRSALVNFQDAIVRFGQANNPAKVLEVRIEMAELLTEINDPMAAINVLSEALPVARFLENPLAEQKVLRRLGVAHSNRGDVDVAALLLKKAAGMKARGPQDQEAALAMECLAHHNEKFGDREKAKLARARVAPVKQALGLESEKTND